MPTPLWKNPAQTAHDGADHRAEGRQSRDGDGIREDGVADGYLGDAGHDGWRRGSSNDVRHGGDDASSTGQDGLSIQEKRWYVAQQYSDIVNIWFTEVLNSPQNCWTRFKGI